MEQEYKWMVYVSCMTYNHAPYIVDALNGFTMQETTFPYVCAVIDDASTDGEQEVIKNYLHEHFDLEDKSIVRNEETNDYVLTFARHKSNKNCYFAVLYLKYNHYSIKKSKAPYIKEWRDNCKYIAFCEGDDYWTDKNKLQKQVDFMEANPHCAMICNRTRLFSEQQQKYIGENYCSDEDGYLSTKEIILRGGLYISTCSILYRESILEKGYPEYCKQCHVGDYPLQIFMAMNGQVYYFNNNMSVYRVGNVNSWRGQRKTISIEKRISTVQSEITMLKGFAKEYPQYHKVLFRRMMAYLHLNFPDRHYSLKEQKTYCQAFKEFFTCSPWIWKFDLWIRQLRIRGVMRLYPYSHLKRFQYYVKYYILILLFICDEYINLTNM